MEKTRKYLLILSIFFLNINYLFYHTIDGYLYKMSLRMLAVLLLLLSILFSKKLKISFKFILVCAYLLIGFVIGNEQLQNILFILLMVYSISINMDDNNVVKTLFVVSLLTLFVFVLLRHFGIIKDTITFYGGRLRNSLGFDNPNSLSLIMIDFFYFFIMKAKKKRNLVCIIVLLMSFYINAYSDSRTLLISTIICVALTMLFELKIFSKITTKLTQNKFICFIVLSLFFISPFLIGVITSNAYSFDKLLSFRGTTINNYILNHSFLNYIIGFSNITTIDNSYIVLFFTVGIIGYLLIFTLFQKAINNLKNKEYITLIIMMLSYGMMESILIRAECLVTIYFWYVIFKEARFISSKREE